MSNAIATMRETLFPITTVLTPNLLEASELLGQASNQKINGKSGVGIA